MHAGFDLELAQQRRPSPGQGGVLGHAREEHLTACGPVQEARHLIGGDTPVGLEVAVHQHHGPGFRLLHTATHEIPLPPVPQQVDVDGGAWGDLQLQGGEGGPALASTQHMGPQLPVVLQDADPGPEPDPGGPGDHHLQAAGVGHQGLTTVHGPHVGGCWGLDQWPEHDLGLELELPRAGIVQLGSIGSAHEQGGHPQGGGVQRGGGHGHQIRSGV